MKQISIDQDIFDYLVSKASTPGEAAAVVLRRELRVPQPQVRLEVDDDTYAVIAAKTSVIGESVSQILRREFHLPGGETPPPTPPPSDPTTVVFHIREGTGSKSWNDGSSMVTATVGDTLRIVNDDSVAHRLHTTGRPFPHPANDIFPGQSARLCAANNL